MLNHFTLAVTTGTPLTIADALIAAGLNPLADANMGLKEHLKFCSIQARASNAAVVYVGGKLRTLTSSDYGYRIEIPVTSIPYAPTVIELGPGIVTLGDIQVLGTTNDFIQILVGF